MATLQDAVRVLEGAQNLVERLNRLVGRLANIVLPLVDASGAKLEDQLPELAEAPLRELWLLVLAADLQKLRSIAAPHRPSG